MLNFYRYVIDSVSVTFLFILLAEDFHLEIKEGQFTDSEIIVMLGENGMALLSYHK